MKHYSVRDVSALLGLSAAQVRSYAGSGFLSVERGPRGEYRFSFQDLVLLRAAKGLIEAKVPPRRIRQSLLKLREDLPGGRPLTAVRIAALGDRVVVRDGDTVWAPESGQVLFDFAVADLASKTAPIVQRAAQAAREDEETVSARDWYELGCDLELSSINEARDAYRRSIEMDPDSADAHVNLGRLLHEFNDVSAAEAHYRAAIRIDSRHAIAMFNLGVSLEDQGRLREALATYRYALALQPALADAHYNLAGIHEQLGDQTSAVRHLKEYKKLSER